MTNDADGPQQTPDTLEIDVVDEPTDAAGYCKRGRAHFVADRLTTALADFEQALSLDPNSAEAHNGRGTVMFALKKLDEAMAEFETAIGLDPSFARAFNNRGLIHRAKGEKKRALKEFDTAIRLDPELPHAYYGRGCCLIELERYEEAIAALTQCLNIEPQGAGPNAMRGVAHHYLHDYEAAIVDLDEAIRLGDESAWVFDCRGCAYHGIERYDEAIADYTKALENDPNYGRAFLNRGWAFHECDNYEAAIADFDEAVRLMAGTADVYYYRGQCWYEQDDYSKAIADFSEAVRIDPTYRRAYKWRAKVWDEIGNEENAKADYERAEELGSSCAEGHDSMRYQKKTIHSLLEKHFHPTPLDDITITERRFPARVQADLQRAIDNLLRDDVSVLHFCGVRKQYSHEGVDFSELLIDDRRDPALSVPPQYEEIDIGEEERVKCLKVGLWLLEQKEKRFVLFLEPEGHLGRRRGIRFQVATINDEKGTQVSEEFFKRLESAVLECECYRGKTLSLEQTYDYTGVSTGITVHKLQTVAREEVILPSKTLELLDRNVMRFIEQRPRLAELQLATKKGLLFYGPPGTGKTHTIHYLAGALKDHTTLLISAEQVALLGEYMTLSRLLQPSMVVIQDVDLIARDRTRMDTPCEEALLNKLLNEMDGLKPNADVLFVLTTNRPEELEASLASRPGRVDQAIEFPLPDEEGRAKLIQLYSRGAEIQNDVAYRTVQKTEKVSASFIKELMRRAMQFHFERSDSKCIEMENVDNALEEMLFVGGSLNRKLLGGNVDDTGSDEG